MRPNQDSIRIVLPGDGLPGADGELLIVADGLGGYRNGDIASRMVCEDLPGLYFGATEAGSRTGLRHAVMVMNEILYTVSSAPGESHGMCTTLVAAAVRDGTLTVVHIGDSKCFLIRGGAVAYASTDHSECMPAFESPGKRYLTQSLGARREVVPSEEVLGLREGDTIVLCSDGLSDTVPLDDIIAACSAGDPPASAAALVKAARRNGATDDVSVVIAQYAAANDPVTPGPADGARLQSDPPGIALPQPLP